MKKKLRYLIILYIMFLILPFGYGIWVISKSATDDGIYSYGKTNSVPVAYIAGEPNKKYTSIEKALDVAQSGDIVCVIPPTFANYNDQTNSVTPDSVSYKISRGCTIKEGVTLFIPTDKASAESVKDASTLSSYIDSQKKPTRNQGKSGYNAYATSNQSRFLRITIEIEPEVTLTNNGTLLVSGYLSGGTSGAGVVGQTSHSYSRIILDSNAKIEQNKFNANLYCFGYIQESSLNNGSQLLLKNGNLYIPGIINDYRGFQYSFAMTNGAIDTNRCSAFNTLEFRNIDVLTDISYNSKVYAIMNVYVVYSTLNVDETISITQNVVGTDPDLSFLIQQNDSTYSSISYKYNSKEGTMKIKFYGGFVFNYLNLSLSLKGQKLNLSTKNAYFPISYKFDIDLLKADGQTSALFNVSNQRMKIMTGASLYLGDDVTLKGNELICYSAFYDGNDVVGEGVGNLSRPVYPLKIGGIVKCSSTSTISMNSIAGVIYSDIPSNINSNITNICSKEPWSMGSSGSINPPWTITNYLELNEQLNVVPLSNLNEKKKIYSGVNTFTNTNNFVPIYDVKINSKQITEKIEKYQRVLFFDDISDYSLSLVSNIFTAYCNNKKYALDATLVYSESTPIIVATNSNKSISNNNNGLDEFRVQSVSITGPSDKVDRGTVLQLTGTVIDIEKSYDKATKWTSLDESVATVDQEGLVKGISFGSTTIQLECGGEIGTYLINVTEPVEDIPSVSTVTITNNQGKNYGDTFKDGKYEFSASITDEKGKSLSLPDINSIEWSFKNVSSVVGERIYFGTDSNNKLVSTSGSLSATITVAGGLNANSDLGASPDNFYVVCTVTDKKGEIKTSDFYVVNDNAVSGSGCFVEGTHVTMANGTKKPVEDIQAGDSILAFNHETGKLEASEVVFNDEECTKEYNVVWCEFSNGSKIGVVYEHGFFCVEENKYVYIDENNYASYIGKHFVTFDAKGNKEVVKLTDSYVEQKVCRIYSPVTKSTLNYFTEGMLSMPGGIRGLFNIFEYDPSTLKYDEAKKQEDIEKYGLFNLEDFGGQIDEFMFDAFNGQYLSVSIGKGMLTWERIEELIKRYAPLCK